MIKNGVYFTVKYSWFPSYSRFWFMQIRQLDISWNFVMSATTVLSFSSVQKKLWEIFNFLWFYTTLCPQNDVTSHLICIICAVIYFAKILPLFFFFAVPFPLFLLLSFSILFFCLTFFPFVYDFFDSELITLGLKLYLIHEKILTIWF